MKESDKEWRPLKNGGLKRSGTLKKKWRPLKRVEANTKLRPNRGRRLRGCGRRGKKVKGKEWDAE